MNHPNRSSRKFVCKYQGAFKAAKPFDLDAELWVAEINGQERVGKVMSFGDGFEPHPTFSLSTHSPAEYFATAQFVPL